MSILKVFVSTSFLISLSRRQHHEQNDASNRQLHWNADLHRVAVALPRLVRERAQVHSRQRVLDAIYVDGEDDRAEGVNIDEAAVEESDFRIVGFVAFGGARVGEQAQDGEVVVIVGRGSELAGRRGGLGSGGFE